MPYQLPAQIARQFSPLNLDFPEVELWEQINQHKDDWGAVQVYGFELLVRGFLDPMSALLKTLRDVVPGVAFWRQHADIFRVLLPLPELFFPPSDATFYWWRKYYTEFENWYDENRDQLVWVAEFGRYILDDPSLEQKLSKYSGMWGNDANDYVIFSLTGGIGSDPRGYTIFKRSKPLTKVNFDDLSDHREVAHRMLVNGVHFFDNLMRDYEYLEYDETNPTKPERYYQFPENVCLLRLANHDTFQYMVYDPANQSFCNPNRVPEIEIQKLIDSRTEIIDDIEF